MTASAGGRATGAEPCAWWAVAITLLANLGLLLGLRWAMQATDATGIAAVFARQPIIWLPASSPRLPEKPASARSGIPARPPRSPDRRVENPPHPAVSARTDRETARPAAEAIIVSSRPVAANGSDRWSLPTPAPAHQSPMFKPDPLRLQRRAAFPASVARMSLRLRPTASFASLAQAKACGALYKL